MLERDIEKALVKRIKALGGLCEKFVSPSNIGVPDRLVTLPGKILFIELKSPGKKPTAKQLKDHAKRRAYGCTVLVIDSLEGIDDAFPF